MASPDDTNIETDYIDGSVSFSNISEFPMVLRPLRCVVCPIALTEGEKTPTVLFEIPACHGDFCHKLRIMGYFHNLRIVYPITYPDEQYIVLKTLPGDDGVLVHDICPFPEFGLPLFTGQPFYLAINNPKGVVSAVGWFGKFYSADMVEYFSEMDSIKLKTDDGVVVTIEKPARW